MDAPSTAFPVGPVSPMSPQIQGLDADWNAATTELLASTELLGSVTSKVSASGAPLSAPSGMAVMFLMRRTTGPTGWPLTVTCPGAKSADQFGGR